EVFLIVASNSTYTQRKLVAINFFSNRGDFHHKSHSFIVDGFIFFKKVFSSFMNSCRSSSFDLMRYSYFWICYTMLREYLCYSFQYYLNKFLMCYGFLIVLTEHRDDTILT